ncbi:C-C motif chemokine 3-like [Simochromis diagramma]|uniref:C-C motif chemokine 3-like n=1 Tax=Simochromis diagramma TaxID=43689 RepID=UPI001A7EA68D|nr:C-C motif chemokine 3-like [Simochromis diagramma]
MMMMMKNPVILMACIVLLSSLVTSDSTFGPEKCCFQFLHKRFPANRVTSFEYTDKRCAMEGVLLKTVGDKQLCADPTMQWVKKIIESIQSKNAATPGFHGPGSVTQNFVFCTINNP